VKAMSRDMKISYDEADKLAPASIPMGGIAEVDEVANLVTMLASPLMEMVNGTMIEVDGGQDKALSVTSAGSPCVAHRPEVRPPMKYELGDVRCSQ